MDCQSTIMLLIFTGILKENLLFLTCYFSRIARFCSLNYHRLISCSSNDFQLRVFLVNSFFLDE